MKIRTEPCEIWREYEKCRGYNSDIGLYETVEQNERFYIGKQWEGLNAPDLDKPVLNFLKRVCSYFVSQIVSDDIGISLSPHETSEESTRSASLLSRECDKVIESEKLTDKFRECIRDAVVDGDTALYFSFDPEAERISAEVLDNTRVLFGNPYCDDKERQPYILIQRPMMLESVRDEAAQAGLDPDEVVPDDAEDQSENESFAGDELTTVLYKLWRENGTIHFTKVTRTLTLKEPTDLGYSLYPISYMSWEKVKGSYHGRAAVTGLIPNQIAVNKLWAMALHHQQMMAFPKIIYDKTRLPGGWSNRAGEAIGVPGDPATVVATGYRAPDMSAQLTDIVERTVSMTRDFMGASDAALGNVEPSNTSAIIALQKASAAPLELNKLGFYRFVEDSMRVVIELICRDYGPRTVTMPDAAAGKITVDFDNLELSQFELKVDVGGASYWNEMTQVSTIDNLFSKGIITDPVTYLEAIPDSYIKNKNRIIESIKRERASQETFYPEVSAVGRQGGETGPTG